jgi:hypothetical protein
MAKKEVTIEVIDYELESVVTGGGNTVYDYNNVPNSAMASSIVSGNVGEAGCSQTQDPMEYNMTQSGGAPTTNWTPWSFDSSHAPGSGNPWCDSSFRATPLPTQASGRINLTGAGGSFPELVVGHDFNSGSVSYTQAVSVNPLESGIDSYGIIDPPTAGAPWAGFRSLCGDIGLGASNPTTTDPPILNTSGAFMRLTNALSDTCNAGGSTAYCGIYQVIQGLVAGTTYVLEIKLKDADQSSNGALRLGNHYFNNGKVLSGNTYNNLGGDNAFIYGTGAAGDYWSVNHPVQHFQSNIQSVQSAEFTSVGGKEVLSIEYISNAPTVPGGTGIPAPNPVASDFIEIDYISIKKKEEAPWNLSGVYNVCSVYDSNAQAVPAQGELRLSIAGGQFTSGPINQRSMIEICGQTSQFPIQGASGLQPLITTPMRLSTNPMFAPTHSIQGGYNAYTININQTSSTTSYTANQRFLSIRVYNPSGVTTRLESCDLRFEYVTSSNSYLTVNEDKSVIGTLDVSDSEDFPLNISYTISDGKDLESRFGDYSQTFELPATKNNNKLLNSLWKSTADQTDKKTYGIKDCRVLVNGTPFFEGSIQVKKSAHTSRPKSYSCTIYGGNFSWMSLLKDKKLCDVFEDSDTFTYTYPEIWDTFQKKQHQTDIQYPLISYKDFNTGGNPSHVNMFNIERVPDFQPSFYVKNIIEKIFSGIGYEIDSTFIDTTHFKRLLNTFPFIDNDAKDDNYHYTCTQVRQKDDWQEVDSSVGLNSVADWTTVVLNSNVIDPSMSYNNATGVWTCQKAGAYSVEAQSSCRIYLTSHGGDCNWPTSTGSCFWGYTVTAPDDTWAWAHRVKLTTASGTVSYIGTGSGGIGVPSYQRLSFENQVWSVGCYDNSDTANTIPPGTVICGVGDTIELQTKFLGISLVSASCEPDVRTDIGYGSDTVTYGSIQPRMTITFDGTAPSIGGVHKLKSILPCDVTQIQYIKSIAHLFNLYFTTDVVSKKVIIEPFNEFFYKSNSVNWDNLIDTSQPVEDDYNIGLKKELVVGYKLDSQDIFARELNFKAGLYGDATRLYNYYESLGEDYESGKLELINPLFASSTQVWDNDAFDYTPTHQAPVLIPNLWNEDCYVGLDQGNHLYRPATLIESYIPRIFYYCFEAAANAGETTHPSGDIVNPGGLETMWTRENVTNGGTSNWTWYPRATFVDWEEQDHSLTHRPSLSFTDETFDAPQTAISGVENTTPGLYTVYYKNMIEQLKKSPRIRTVYLNLKIKDILNLDMRRLVYLDESWWRINRISEYSPAKNETTRVELIQWLEVGFWPVYSGTTIIEYT